MAQVSLGNAVSGSMAAGHVVPNRSVPRSMPVVGMQRMHPQSIAAYNLSSQAAMGGGMNPGNIPMQRGVAAQPHQQQQQVFLFFLFEISVVRKCLFLFLIQLTT